MVICINNSNISFDDIINSIKIANNPYKHKGNYYELWKRKIEFFEKYYYKEDCDFYYYNGLSYNALYLVKQINYLNITYGNSFNRFYNIHSLFDLYNLVEYGPIMNSIVEYIKYEFFFNNREVKYIKIFNLQLNIEDYYYFIARLLFPTYYYDLFKDNNIEKDYQIVLNRIYDYMSYVKRIIMDIKKRHNNMPFLDYILNLL